MFIETIDEAYADHKGTSGLRKDHPLFRALRPPAPSHRMHPH
jgi:hypothetical protein